MIKIQNWNIAFRAILWMFIALKATHKLCLNIFSKIIYEKQFFVISFEKKNIVFLLWIWNNSKIKINTADFIILNLLH